MIILNVGTFDDPNVAKPGREIFRDDALPWVGCTAKSHASQSGPVETDKCRLHWCSQH
jgi:hypothetical protein